MSKTNSSLVFVYNADSTLASAAGNFLTRIFAPDNYSCNLCKVTYGPVKMKLPWEKFLDTLLNEKIFLHRDEFKEQYPKYNNMPLPVIFIKLSGNLEVLISAEEINNIKHWEELKTLLVSRLKDD